MTALIAAAYRSSDIPVPIGNRMPTKTRQLVGRIVSVLACLVAMCGLSNSAFADGTGQITGTVSASLGIALEQTVVYIQSAPGSFSAGNSNVNMAGLKLQPQVPESPVPF